MNKNQLTDVLTSLLVVEQEVFNLPEMSRGPVVEARYKNSKSYILRELDKVKQFLKKELDVLEQRDAR